MNVIKVEIICPSVSRKYDYHMPVKMRAGEIKKQVIGDIRLYEGISSLFENEENLNLFCERCIIDDNATISEAGVKNGDKLMII